MQRYTPDLFTLQGVADASKVIGKLCRFVVRPSDRPGYPWRSGIGIVHEVRGDCVECDASGIPAFCEGDFVYLVED